MLQFVYTLTPPFTTRRPVRPAFTLILTVLVSLIIASASPVHSSSLLAASDTTRINAGGGTYTDGSGQVWAADTGFSGGATYSTATTIAGTSDGRLYQSVRYGNFGYSLAVPNGAYRVTLKFAEVYWTSAGKRVFNVALEGQTLLTNFDILHETAPNTALDKTFPVNVTDGVLNIVFTTVTDNALVGAIEVLPSPSPTSVRLNIGGGAYTDGSRQVWTADTGFSGGATYTTATTIAGTNDPRLYQSVRYGNFGYSLAVPNGVYRVTLKFAEVYWTSAGKRVFNVALEGQTLLTNFDILTQVAPNTAVDRSFLVTVNDGVLNIVFTTVADNALVGAIEVLPSGTAATDPVVAAAGDIACDPANVSYNGGNGTPGACRMRATSDLLLTVNPHAVLALGDNQYEDGALSKFRQSYDPTWGRLKGITYPVVGNHEYGTPGAAGYFDYFGAVAGPRDKGYYSFDLGAWHIIALNSNCWEVGGCGAGSPQEQWLRSDLASHPTRCTLAFWHHPRSSSGPYGDDTAYEPFWRALYEAGADVVLTGHSHNYERFAPEGPGGVADSARGLREFVVGTGGRSHYGLSTIQPNSEVRNIDTYGVLKLTLRPTAYEWQFVPEPGATFTDTGTTACH